MCEFKIKIFFLSYSSKTFLHRKAEKAGIWFDSNFFKLTLVYIAVYHVSHYFLTLAVLQYNKNTWFNNSRQNFCF